MSSKAQKVLKISTAIREGLDSDRISLQRCEELLAPNSPAMAELIRKVQEYLSGKETSDKHFL